MKIKLALVLALIIHGFANAGDYNIRDLGAVADTTKLSTKAIQSAIDKCFSEGGGRVVIPAGNFLSGSLTLKDNVCLHLSKGATLYGSRHFDDYIARRPAYVALRTRGITKQLIYAENARNISITGEGVIDGQGRFFPDKSDTDVQYDRPCIIQFINCSMVLTEGVSLRNSGFWMQHYLACDRVQIRGISVFNHSNKNNDGIDIDGCQDVLITDVTIDSDDDALCLKSTSGRASENVNITNCILSSHCNAFKLGTESNTGFRNITVSNLTIKPSQHNDSRIYGQITGISGIAIEMVDGGILDGVSVSNVVIEGTSCPLFIRLGNRARPYRDNQFITHVGTLRNVSVSHVMARGAGNFGCSITGIPGYPVENIRLSDISIEFVGGGTREHVAREIPELETKYPEATMFGILPSYGFFIRHAQNIQLSGIRLSTSKEDQRPALIMSDTRDLEISDLTMTSTPGSQSNLILEKGSGILVSGCRIRGNSVNFADLKGDQNRDIVLMNNVLTGAGKVVSYGMNAKKAVSLVGNVQ